MIKRWRQKKRPIKTENLSEFKSEFQFRVASLRASKAPKRSIFLAVVSPVHSTDEWRAHISLFIQHLTDIPFA